MQRVVLGRGLLLHSSRCLSGTKAAERTEMAKRLQTRHMSRCRSARCLFEEFSGHRGARKMKSRLACQAPMAWAIATWLAGLAGVVLVVIPEFNPSQHLMKDCPHDMKLFNEKDKRQVIRASTRHGVPEQGSFMMHNLLLLAPLGITASIPEGSQHSAHSSRVRSGRIARQQRKQVARSRSDSTSCKGWIGIM